MTLRWAGQLGSSGYGWATCSNALYDELSKLCDMRGNGERADVVFVPVANHKLEPVSPVRGDKWTVGYCFFESPLEPEAAENAKQYDILFCGSTWNLERLREKGITNGQVLIQGVDHGTFQPMDVPRGKEFRIFSGGKFEHRKGQDIVIAAFRELCKRHDNLKLVTAWHNPWPGLITDGIVRSPHIKSPIGYGWDTQQNLFRVLTETNGIPEENVEHHGPLSQPELAAVMNSTDLGVFPNRCEGGTNLVLMEYMACGKPVVATMGTGHADILNVDNCHGLTSPSIDGRRDEVDPEAVAWVIEEIITDKGPPLIDRLEQFTWERAARQIVETVEELNARGD